MMKEPDSPKKIRKNSISDKSKVMHVGKLAKNLKNYKCFYRRMSTVIEDASSMRLHSNKSKS